MNFSCSRTWNFSSGELLGSLKALVLSIISFICPLLSGLKDSLGLPYHFVSDASRLYALSSIDLCFCAYVRLFDFISHFVSGWVVGYF